LCFRNKNPLAYSYNQHRKATQLTQENKEIKSDDLQNTAYKEKPHTRKHCRNLDM